MINVAIFFMLFMIAAIINFLATEKLKTTYSKLLKVSEILGGIGMILSIIGFIISVILVK